MIGQVQKPIDEILEYLDGKEKIVIVGCGGCATVFQTGGEKQVEEMAEILTKHGKRVLATIAPPFKEFTCYAPWSKERLDKHRQEIEECDAFLMLSCGDGLQVVREIVEEDYDLIKPLYPGVDPKGHMGGGPVFFKEKCQQCGECELGMMAGICPLTQCPKGLLNGPCGGVSKDGKCEVDPERDCAWVMIYERLKMFEDLEKMKQIIEPKDWSQMTRAREIELEEAYGG